MQYSLTSTIQHHAADLLNVRHALDRAVDARYGKKNFKSEPEWLEFLFERYKALVE